jgi:putative phosphoribosyl transferase
MPFLDRADAGRRLAAELAPLRAEQPVVLGLPRGGVPVAYQVALALDAPLDVIVVRKLGVPFQPELGMGAIGEGSVRILNDQIVAAAGVTRRDLAAVEQRERAELDRRTLRFRGGRARVPLSGRTAIIVDDGIATGSTARAACQVARALGATRVVLAAPVAPPTSISQLRGDADEVVCLELPRDFLAIGQFYADFTQTSDEEVRTCLDRAAARPHAAPEAGVAASGAGPPDPPTKPTRNEEVEIQADRVRLPGRLTLPQGAPGIVVFAHGSGSSRHSARNRFVAAVLNQAGLGTLLFDLLTPAEEFDRANVFDIGLLAARLADVTGWLRAQPEGAGARIGYFGASTGAAAALWAAADLDADIAAVVCRGGRPDLAAPRLAAVRAPTLLIVGGDDDLILALNRRAQAQLRCKNRLAVVPGATHLFEEPGTLRAAAGLARSWFTENLRSTRSAGARAGRPG